MRFFDGVEFFLLYNNKKLATLSGIIQSTVENLMNGSTQKMNIVNLERYSL